MNDLKEINVFFHYDSDVVDQDTKQMKVKVPKNGLYYWTAHNISIKFPDGYTPDTYNGYICVCGFQLSQSGIIKVSGKSGTRTGILFPLREPGSVNPKCKTYNKVYLNEDDQFKITYVDKDLKIVEVDRIVMTFHCVSNIKYMYID